MSCVALKLYAHQAQVSQAVERMLAEKGRAAVILPTGTGKSYIAFRLIEQHPEAAFLWLAPSEYIFRTQTENLRRTNPELSLAHVTFRTYASLIYQSPEALAAMPCEYIVLDEFHRCGAEQWGAAVQQLLDSHPQAKLLGLSATHIRYLDHQRNMAEELLDNCIAAEMTLGEAIVRGILPAPKYVTTVYQYQKNLASYEARVASQRNKRYRERGERYLQALRRTLEQAEGLDAVFARHMTDRQGRYIVFCAGVEHMREIHAHIQEWFHAVDAAPHCYQVYAENAEASAAYNAFRQDNSDHLKLLLCVNMLNEGVHVEDIAGVILFRPTVSPIIYKQQIGRALTAGGNVAPLILDVVNNVEGLYSIDAIGQEMQEAVRRLRAEGREELIVRERFRVIDQVQDCRRLFEHLEDSLHIEWEDYYMAAAAYRAEHGDLLIPQRYVTEDGKCLGRWLTSQRRIHNSEHGGTLTGEQEIRLEALGIVWDSLPEAAWEAHYAEAARYREEHGHLNMPVKYVDGTGFALGIWLQRMRLKRQRWDELTGQEQEQLTRLDGLGMVWNCHDWQWQHNLALCRAYAAKHGNLLIPVDYRAEDGTALGQWIVNLRSARKGNMPARRLSEEQITQLDELGMVWDSAREDRWMQWYGEAKAYYQAHGNLAVRKDFVTEDGHALGVWLVNQRANRRRGQGRAMTPERVRLLDDIGMRW